MRGQMPAFDGSTGQGVSISQEFTANSGTLAPNGESTVVVTHNLGIAPSIVAGHLEDGSGAHTVGWRVNSRTTTQVSLQFRSNTNNTVSAVLRFRLIY